MAKPKTRKLTGTAAAIKRAIRETQAKLKPYRVHLGGTRYRRFATEQEAREFCFAELSDGAKERAREWYRQGEAEDFGNTDCLLEPAQTAGALLGIEFGTRNNGEPIIYWSGFSSQGDGASFEGTYSYAQSDLKKIRAEFPTDETLHEIADALFELQKRHRFALTATIKRSGNYVHEYTMSADVTLPEDEDEDTPDEDVQAELVALEPEEEDVEDVFLEIMRKFARWIYRGIEAEYEYRMSNEYVDDSIRANEYEFTEDGERA